MKTHRFNLPAAAALGAALLLTSGCPNKDAATAQPGPTASTVPAAPAPNVPAPAARPAADPGTPFNVITDTPSPSWDDIKDLTYAQHAAFSAGLARIEGRLDAQISALNAKRAAMTTDTKDWDFAMKDVNESRSYLTGLNEEVATAGPDTWTQEKEKVEAALKRAEDACEKVKMSTTS
jgi:hypothetical protein